MRWFVITTNTYLKYGPFKDQLSAAKYGKHLGVKYKIICKDF